MVTASAMAYINFCWDEEASRCLKGDQVGARCKNQGALISEGVSAQYQMRQETFKLQKAATSTTNISELVICMPIEASICMHLLSLVNSFF
jgi:hypothetical protein